MVSWSSDTRSSEKLSSDSKSWICWSPAKARSHLFWHLIPCRSKVLGILYFFNSLQKQSHNYLNLLICWPPTETRSHLFLALDPLQKQGLGHSLFFNSLLRKSRNSSWICWSPAEARSHLILALDPLQKQGLGHSLLFDSLQKQSHNHLLLFDSLQKQSYNFSLTCWSSAKARSPLFFSACDDIRTKSVSLSLLNFYFDNTNFSQIFILSLKLK